MSDIVNLNQLRKAKERKEQEKRATENRAKFGRTKQQVQKEKDDAARAKKHLDGHKRDHDNDDA